MKYLFFNRVLARTHANSHLYIFGWHILLHLWLFHSFQIWS